MYINRVIKPRVMLGYSWKNFLFFVIFGLSVTAAYKAGLGWIALPFTPVGTLGMAVAIVVGFHNNSAYDRWCRAHNNWQELEADSRIFAAQVLAVLPRASQAEGLVRRRLTVVRTLRDQLRDRIHPVESDENAQPQLAFAQMKDLNEAFEQEHCSDEMLAQLIGYVGHAQRIASECMTTKRTPLPRQFGFVTQIFVWVFVLLLPMGFLAELGWGTMPLSALLSIIFITLEQVGRFTEDPFANHMNDVPVDAMTRRIERELMALLGDSPLPPQLEPQAGVLN